MIHLFHSKASIAMEIHRLPSHFSWPFLTLTDIAGNEALLPAPSAVTSQNSARTAASGTLEPVLAVIDVEMLKNGNY
jgi:hypothetical protein